MGGPRPQKNAKQYRTDRREKVSLPNPPVTEVSRPVKRTVVDLAANEEYGRRCGQGQRRGAASEVVDHDARPNDDPAIQAETPPLTRPMKLPVSYSPPGPRSREDSDIDILVCVLARDVFLADAAS